VLVVPIAQLVELQSYELAVGGSSPPRNTIYGKFSSLNKGLENHLFNLVGKGNFEIHFVKF
jgi:hypothetical protein